LRLTWENERFLYGGFHCSRSATQSSIGLLNPGKEYAHLNCRGVRLLIIADTRIANCRHDSNIFSPRRSMKVNRGIFISVLATGSFSTCESFKKHEPNQKKEQAYE